MNRHRYRSAWLLVSVMLSTIVAWTAFVVLSGLSFNLFGLNWDFERTGQLGDSFGFVSSIMTATAAYFAVQTYRFTRNDIDRLERRAAEASYLSLLERRYDVLDRVSRTTVKFQVSAQFSLSDETLFGQPCLDHIAMTLRKRVREIDGLKTPSAIFGELVLEVFGLPNLYRFTYHLVSFADRNLANGDDEESITKTV